MTSTEENETPDEAVAAKVAEITALKDEIATLEQKIEKNEEETED
jgi:ubiquinone biosynthesis protein UbiJ